MKGRPENGRPVTGRPVTERPPEGRPAEERPAEERPAKERPRTGRTTTRGADGTAPGAPGGQEAPELSDERLDAWILARLELAGVDLGVLPDDDPDAPADRTRILASARRFLRSTPPAILAFEPDVQEVPPEMYPAELAGRALADDGAGGD